MATIQREFYRSARGPTPGDQDVWCLAFDRATGSLLVRHEWLNEHHSGVDEFEVQEFLTEQGAEQAALLTFLFGEATAEV